MENRLLGMQMKREHK